MFIDILSYHIFVIGRQICHKFKAVIIFPYLGTSCVVLSNILRVGNITTPTKCLRTFSLTHVAEIELVKTSTSTMISTQESHSRLYNSLQLSVQILIFRKQGIKLILIFLMSLIIQFTPNIIRNIVFRSQSMLIHVLLHQLNLIIVTFLSG